MSSLTSEEKEKLKEKVQQHQEERIEKLKKQLTKNEQQEENRIRITPERVRTTPKKTQTEKVRTIPKKAQKDLERYTKILFGAALFCLLISFVSCSVGKNAYKVLFSSNNIAKVSLKKSGRIHKIEVQAMRKPSPAGYDIELTLLDNNEKHLFSFYDSFWYEEGWDSDGHWSEGNTKSEMLFVLQEAGDYYLQASTPQPIKVRVIEGAMLSRYFIILTVILVVASFLMPILMNKERNYTAFE